MKLKFLASACLAILLAQGPFALAEIRLADTIPVGPQVKVGKLPNGLTYYIQKNSRPEKKLELRLVVKAGSILEDEDQQGLAHFLEHLAFNGSTHFKQHELTEYLQSIGVKMGADLNAYTSFDETVYMLPIPTDRPENVDKGFQVLEDWAHGLTLADADIEKERAIVLEEARLGKGAGERMNKIVMPKMYNGSRYAQRLPIGQEAVIKSFKPDAVRRFYRDWYRPDLMAVVIVGDIDPARAEQLVKTHFGAMKNPSPLRARSYAPISARAATEAVVATDKEASGNAVMIRYPVRDARERNTFGAYREKLIDLMFSSMLNQRMQELTQQANPPFMGGGSSLGKLTPRYKSYGAVAALGKDGAAPAIAALVQENERARQFGFSEGELDRSKKNFMRAMEQQYNEREKTNSITYVSEYTRNFLEREEIPGIENEYNYARELVPGITLAEVNRYARETIPSNSAKLVVYTGSSNGATPAPSTGELLAWVDAAAKSKVTAHQEKQIASSLMTKPPAPGAIVAETADKALGLTRLTLSNGVKVILKPTEFNNDQVFLSASRPGGLTQFAEKDIVNARYATSIVDSMGLNELSPLDMQKAMAGKVAGAGLGIGQYQDSVGGSAGSSDVELMLQMVYLRFTTLRRDEELYKSYLGKRLESARNVMAQPAAVFSDALIGTMYNDSPWVARPPRPADFASLNMDRAIALYKERFGSAKGMTFIMVGSFDVEKIKPMISTYLASLPTPDLPLAFKDVGVRPVKGIVKKEVFSGAEQKSQVAINFSGPATYSEDEQMRLQAVVDVMNLRINDILREKLTLIYSGRMNGAIEKIPYGHYSVGMALPTGPANVDKTIAAAFAEIAQLKEKGPSAADLGKVKQNWIQVHRRSMRENGYWLHELQSSVTLGTDPVETVLTYEQRVAAITAQDVQAAAARYLDTNNYVQVVLYPEKK